MVVTNIYDIEVKADNLEEAQGLAIDTPEKEWMLDKSATTAYLGDDHMMLEDGSWVYV
jgi:hypothetical protein